MLCCDIALRRRSAVKSAALGWVRRSLMKHVITTIVLITTLVFITTIVFVNIVNIVIRFSKRL